MKNKLKCKVILLPQDKSSGVIDVSQFFGNIFFNKDRVLSIFTDEEDILKSMQWFGTIPQHLYFVSDREGKGPYIDLDDLHDGIRYPDSEGNMWNASNKVIEATTDKSLGLPLIAQSFLEGYVQRKGEIKEVWIDMYDDLPVCTGPSDLRYHEVIISPSKDSWNREEIQPLIDSIKNLLGAVNTPVRRLKFPYEFLDEAIEIAKNTVKPFEEWFDKNY
jgi:hypothetical protein